MSPSPSRDTGAHSRADRLGAQREMQVCGRKRTTRSARGLIVDCCGGLGGPGKGLGRAWTGKHSPEAGQLGGMRSTRASVSLTV